MKIRIHFQYQFLIKKSFWMQTFQNFELFQRFAQRLQEKTLGLLLKKIDDKFSMKYISIRDYC